MKPAPFKRLVPRSLAEALALAEEHAEEARFLSGGQSLVPLMNLRMATPAVLIDLNHVPELAEVVTDHERLTLGATTRQLALERDGRIARHAPMLRDGAPLIGHFQTRARGTVGGSVAHADPSAELPMMLLALRARIGVRSAHGSRELTAKEFFLDAMTVDLKAGELVEKIVVPPQHPHAGSAVRELARGEVAIAAAAAQVRIEDERCADIAVALGGVGPTPIECDIVREALLHGIHDPPERITDACRAQADALAPQDDLHASAEYRRKIAAAMLERCLAAAIGDAQERMAEGNVHARALP